MAFDIALSGINAAQNDLDVISHNIANTGTTGFKSSRADFADVYAATQTGLSRNAIGSGVDLKSVRQQFTQGGISFTANNLDLAISGQGFFRVSEQGTTAYTRAGTFGVDRDGNIVNSSGQVLQGYQASNGTLTGAVGDLVLDFSDFPPQSTTELELGANLDATESPAPTVPFNPADETSYNHSTATTVYDSLGTSHIATMYYAKAADNTWNVHVYVGNQAATAAAGIPVTFDNSGNRTSPTISTLNAVTPPGGAGPISMSLDQTNVTQYGSPFSVNKLTQNGFANGRLTDLDIDQEGVVFARFSNGNSSVLGQVVLANFTNPQGLQQLGETSWGETFESGPPLVSAPGTASLGLVQSGAVEESNVDLTAELVKMITAQRNFQANAEVITTADTVTQTVINIR